MKNPANQLQKAIFDRLTGAITILGANVPVYDKVPNRPWDNSKQYDAWVHIGDVSITPKPGTKDVFITTVIATIEIIVLFKKQANAGGNKIVNDIANIIQTRLITRGGAPITLTNFDIIGQVLGGFDTVPTGEVEGGLIYEAGQLRINYTVEER